MKSCFPRQKLALWVSHLELRRSKSPATIAQCVSTRLHSEIPASDLLGHHAFESDDIRRKDLGLALSV
jgi:hypothetical protein